MYDCYGVYDYMSELLKALIVTPEEKLQTADRIFEIGSEELLKNKVKFSQLTGAMT